MSPLVFRDIVNDYIANMSEWEYKAATTEVRKIFAVQFLTSIYQQGVYFINEISRDHVGNAILSASSVTGMSQKLPCFLDFLFKKGLTVPELQKAIPSIIPKKNLPSVYSRDELIQTLSDIDTSTFPMKRDYTILVFLMTYEFSIKEIKSIVSLELSEQKVQEKKWAWMVMYDRYRCSNH